MTEFVQQFDVEPQFWQYFRGLSSSDLLVELIQNELDAGAVRSQITFHADRLTCEGNGSPIDEDGWSRLKFVMGAGDRAPRKLHRIGVKNHGLKVCFRIGDEIVLRSAGQLTRQTLYRYGLDNPPSPGTYPRPEPDPGGPDRGCFLELPYRVQKLIVKTGEPFELDPPSEESLEKLFRDASEHLPQILLGVIRPGVRDSYVLEIRHHLLGLTRLEFRSSGRPVTRGRFRMFNRECRISSEPEGLSGTLRERCALFSTRLPSGEQEMPDFFSARAGSFWAEVSWKMARSGRPLATVGSRRYPIGYAGHDDSGVTDVGVHFSGPYRSDPERRGTIEDDELNTQIDDVCKTALVDVLRLELVPRYGAKALELLIADAQRLDEEVLRDLVERSLSAKALPLLTRSSRRRFAMRPHSPRSQARAKFGPRRSAEGERAVVLPVFTWDLGTVSSLLSSVCPDEENQIDPLVPAPILRLLASRACQGFGKTHTTFDEGDAIARLQPETPSAFFPWDGEAEWCAALGNPETARAYLDIVSTTIDSGVPGLDDGQVAENAFLPSTSAIGMPLRELFATSNLPPRLPDRDMPPILHPEVGNHRIFKRKAWRRPRYTFDEYLSSADLAQANEETRDAFWRWLKANWKTVPRPSLRRVAGLPVWPDDSDLLTPLPALCRPRAAHIRAILKDEIRVPSAQVLNLRPVREARAGRLSIRTEPSKEEFERYLQARLAAFRTDAPMSARSRRAFHEFEAELAELASIRGIRRHLAELGQYALGLSVDGYVRPVAELAYSAGKTAALHLVDHDTIDRTNGALDRLDGWMARTEPTSDQILTALRQDARRVDALLVRMQAYLQAVAREGGGADEIAGVPCIPVGGNLLAPNCLAFAASNRDYWGAWKEHLSVKGLSAEEQSVYRSVGVLSSDPSRDDSLAFFRWLSSQRPTVITLHLDQVLRHINHRYGPQAWWEEHPTTPFIPVESDGGEARLVSLPAATGPRSRVVVPDFEAIEDRIRLSPLVRSVDLAIVTRPRVTEPIAQLLQRFGVKTLRSYMGEPVEVNGADSRQAAKVLVGRLHSLRSKRMARELRKRLEEIGLGVGKLKAQWRDRLNQIADVKIARSVTATYRIGRLRAGVVVPSAFDARTGTLWLTDVESDLEDGLFGAIAARVFDDPARIDAIALQDAVRHELRERDLFGGASVESDEEEDEEDEQGDENENGTGLGGAQQSHAGAQPDPKKNLPKPGPIPVRGGGRRLSIRHGRGKSRETSPNEKAQIQDLKKNHYAWHCQVCLAEKSISVLAPEASYAGIQENRLRIMEAHHADQWHAGGARHAGNLLILCLYHHDYLGDATSRDEITKALQSRSKDHDVPFNTTQSGDRRTVRGKLVTVPMPLRGASVSFFFTNEHAAYWLEKASEEA